MDCCSILLFCRLLHSLGFANLLCKVCWLLFVCVMLVFDLVFEFDCRDIDKLDD